mmetsp:Transcript_5765/g.12481  ORF Transcript_5765/g.12481 Transcript_5765/m.12481 type:complete len:256 (-) Transcript_5765:68-835(-)
MQWPSPICLFFFAFSVAAAALLGQHHLPILIVVVVLLGTRSTSAVVSWRQGGGALRHLFLQINGSIQTRRLARACLARRMSPRRPKRFHFGDARATGLEEARSGNRGQNAPEGGVEGRQWEDQTSSSSGLAPFFDHGNQWPPGHHHQGRAPGEEAPGPAAVHFGELSPRQQRLLRLRRGRRSEGVLAGYRLGLTFEASGFGEGHTSRLLGDGFGASSGTFVETSQCRALRGFDCYGCLGIRPKRQCAGWRGVRRR